MNIHAHGDGLRRRDEILRIVGEQSVHSQDELLALLRDLAALPKRLGGEMVAQALAERRAVLASVATRLRELEQQRRLTQQPAQLYASFVHMHCNRLFGIDRESERMVLQLLARIREGLWRSSAASQ